MQDYQIQYRRNFSAKPIIRSKNAVNLYISSFLKYHRQHTYCPKHSSAFSFISPLIWGRMHLCCLYLHGLFKKFIGWVNIPYPIFSIITIWRLPFNWKSPIGYLMAVIIQFGIVAYEFFVIACTLSLAISAFWFATSATKEIERIVHSIDDENVKHKRSDEILFKEFSAFIHIHSVVKQLSWFWWHFHHHSVNKRHIYFRVAHNFSEVFQPIFMILFTWSLVAICGALLMIQMQIVECLENLDLKPFLEMKLIFLFDKLQSHHDYDFMVLSVTVFVSCYAFCTLFIACELGQRMNDSFGGITYMIGLCDWQLFPIEVKRMLPAVLAILQQPVSLECFGSILCTREVFKKVGLNQIRIFHIFQFSSDLNKSDAFL